MKRTRDQRPPIVPVSLMEVYTQPGEYTAKLMIDPEVSQAVDNVAVDIWNADGSPIKHTYKRWGTKLNLCFLIEDGTPDGVVTIDVHLNGRSHKINKRFCFWVVPN